MEKAKTKVIQSWPTPKSVKDIQSFLGFANFYWRFILKYSAITKPLTSATKKNITFVWTSDCKSAFQLLKSAFSSALILAHFQLEYKTIIETDALDYAVATVLSQLNPNANEIHPVAFFSQTMQSAKLNYEIHDKELLSIFVAFKEWHTYLKGSVHQVQVITDHKTLKYFNTTKLLT